ncbi:fimbrial biogenesis chaperone [Variovorax terrae]|uniref:Molecular chaperone n=1 Tax=Variovorax terrae TaxID=2923278 RepID=A0A9X1VSW7_9BURK|nr:molecular chaperone [Variovorax terrae]MCJ0763291.1 molecular chaperone [Variovorax terrae]
MFVWAAAALPLPASAAGLQAAPVLVELPARDRSQNLQLSNTGTQPLRAQVRVLQWSQADQSDQLTPTRDVVASPPIVDIAPGATQLVRIVRLAGDMPERERSYRLIVDELPPDAPDSGSAGGSSGALKFLLRYSIPVFVLPAGAKTTLERTQPTELSALKASLRTGADMQLSVANEGAQRVKLSQLSYLAPDGQRTPLATGLLGYVLPGQRMQWPLKLPAPQAQALREGRGTIQARLNDDPQEQVLPLAADRP